MYNFSDLRQSQFIQSGEVTYVLILNCNQPYWREEEIVNEFKQYLGIDAVIEVKYTNKITLLSSGKRKRGVNNYSGK